MRLDVALTERGLAKSRTRAAALIAAGLVTVNGIPAAKPSQPVKEDDAVAVTGQDHGFVGRGGIKLDAALSAFAVDVRDKICVDVGASTGGFTDCLLQHGAAKVYAVDAGHGQLDEKLLRDPRVVNREGVNARGLSQEIIPEPCAVAVLDLSFISQTLVLPALPSILCPGADYIGLVKPQFECGRAALGSGGIVRDRRQHLAALRQVTAALDAVGFGAASVLKSPVTGGDGNTEFLIRATLGGIRTLTERDLEEVVHA